MVQVEDIFNNSTNLRLLYSQRDFQIALSALTFLSEIEPGEEYSTIELRRFRCYLDTAAISYWRPFSRSKGLPCLPIEEFELCDNEKDLHHRIKIYRNKIVAHSDEEWMTIGFHTFEVVEGINMPSIKFKESLDLLDQIKPWTELVLKFVDYGAKALWKIAQESGPNQSFVKHPLGP